MKKQLLTFAFSTLFIPALTWAQMPQLEQQISLLEEQRGIIASQGELEEYLEEQRASKLAEFYNTEEIETDILELEALNLSGDLSQQLHDLLPHLAAGDEVLIRTMKASHTAIQEQIEFEIANLEFLKDEEYGGFWKLVASLKGDGFGQETMRRHEENIQQLSRGHVDAHLLYQDIVLKVSPKRYVRGEEILVFEALEARQNPRQYDPQKVVENFFSRRTLAIHQIMGDVTIYQVEKIIR